MDLHAYERLKSALADIRRALALAARHIMADSSERKGAAERS